MPNPDEVSRIKDIRSDYHRMQCAAENCTKESETVLYWLETCMGDIERLKGKVAGFPQLSEAFSTLMETAAKQELEAEESAERQKECEDAESTMGRLMFDRGES